MRLRLVHTLSLWLLAAVSVSVLAMGGVSAWHLEQGFGAYLQARDMERLDKFVAVVQAAVTEPGGVDALQDRRTTLPMLLAELARQEGDTRPSRQNPDGPSPPPGSGQRRAGPPDAFGARVAIFHADGRPLAGRPLPDGPGALIERPIPASGPVLAVVKLRPINRVADAYEVRFLKSQYLGIAAVALALMLAALGLAAWLSRQWSRQLSAVQDAAKRIARGELDVRLPAHRTDEFGDLVSHINAMAESLQRMEGARRRWVADISHELRTPLTVLRGEVEALVDGVRSYTPATAASWREEVLRLVALVEDLHQLSLADLNSLPLKRVHADAAAMLPAICQRFQGRAAARGLVLHSPAHRPDLAVCWDPDRITQLLENLLENSLRYTDAPGRIEVTLSATEQQVCLQVDDSAPGVDPADLPRLFEPLYRTDGARSRHNGGSGLGLAICEAIATAHGGRIHAEPSPLGGLRVVVSLPRWPETTAP